VLTERICFFLPTVLISFITIDLCLARLQANKLKSHLLISQSLQHKSYHCCVELSPHLWDSYWNENGNLMIMAKLPSKSGNMHNRSVCLPTTWLEQNICMAWLHKLFYIISLCLGTDSL
jgi:hypothetical protein